MAITTTDAQWPDSIKQRLATSNVSQEYALASLVYSCITKDGIVFQDLRNNKYRGISTSDLQILAPYVPDLAAYSRDDDDAQLKARDAGRQVAEALVKAGILTRGRDSRPHIPSRRIDVRGELIALEGETDRDTEIRFDHVWTFLRCCARARYSLTCRPISKVVAGVNATRSSSAVARFDVVRAAELVSIFRRVRSFVFTARGHCLFHALALVTFLQHYEVYASWVMGVKTNPWGAHSWVQEGDYVLDTNPEKVCEFTPILAV